MAIELPPLNYAQSALSPHISEETVSFHYTKHYQGYVNKLNATIKDTQWETKSLEDIIKQITQEGKGIGIFNNAAQIWNHTFYWESLSPQGGGSPTGSLQDALHESFGSFESFKTEFTKVATTTFGSGWAWLVLSSSSKKLEIVSTSNAQTPLTDDKLKPLLTCDVWEHAYYIDYRNARDKYIDAFWNVVNWKFAAQNL